MRGLIRQLLRLRKGYVRIHLCGGSYERFLNLCRNHGILLWDLRPAGFGYEANLAAPDFFRLRPLAAKCRTRVRIRAKYGLPFFLKRHRKRKMFAAGFCLCGVFICLLSSFIWRITIAGNSSISRQMMLEYLQERDVGYGTRKSAVDCRALAAELRNEFPDITWVSVRLAGTELSIELRENADREEETPFSYEDSDLVADADGRIVKMITRAGIPQVREGDEVHAGDVLVRGELEITDDNGETAAYRYCAADADIYLETTLSYRDEFSLTHDAAEYTGRRRYGFYVMLFGKYLGVDLGVNAFERADVLAEQNQLHILRDFYLPLSCGYLCAREYRQTALTYTEEEALRLAQERFEKFLAENAEKGIQIFENNVKIKVSATSCRAAGTLRAVQKTGRRVRTEKRNLPEEGTVG